MRWLGRAHGKVSQWLGFLWGRQLICNSRLGSVNLKIHFRSLAFSFFNWSIIALQCSASFCYSTAWISYTCLPITPLNFSLIQNIILGFLFLSNTGEKCVTWKGGTRDWISRGHPFCPNSLHHVGGRFGSTGLVWGLLLAVGEGKYRNYWALYLEKMYISSWLNSGLDQSCMGWKWWVKKHLPFL